MVCSRPTTDTVQSKGWRASEVTWYVERSREILRKGGFAIGAWQGEYLCGIAVVDLRPVLDGTLVPLDLLHVSAPFRGLGIARVLVARAARKASIHGAAGLYISATPSRNTVEMYLHLGAHILAKPDPRLFALELEDIHMALANEEMDPRHASDSQIDCIS